MRDFWALVGLHLSTVTFIYARGTLDGKAMLRSQSPLPRESLSNSFWGTFLFFFFLSSGSIFFVHLRISSLSSSLRLFPDYLAQFCFFFVSDSAFDKSFCFSAICCPPSPPPRFPYFHRFRSDISSFSLLFNFSLFLTLFSTFFLIICALVLSIPTFFFSFLWSTFEFRTCTFCTYLSYVRICMFDFTCFFCSNDKKEHSALTSRATSFVACCRQASTTSTVQRHGRSGGRTASIQGNRQMPFIPAFSDPQSH